jgi:hypothetical protein
VFSVPSGNLLNGLVVVNGVITNDNRTSATGNIVVPSVIDGYAVTSMAGSAFHWNRNITGITLPQTLTTIENGAFAGCADLQSITLPQTLTTIGNNAFDSCDLTGSIDIPASVYYVGENSFRYNPSLTTVTFLGNKPETLNLNAFRDCINITDIYYPSDAIGWTGTEAFYINPTKTITVTATP